MQTALLNKIKTLLGITGSAQDEFIALKGDALLARMRAGTGATLYPVRRYMDIFRGQRYWTHPAAEGIVPRHQPVVTIESAIINGAEVLDPASIKVTTDGRISFFDECRLYYSDLVLTYTAGFPDLPPDLLDALAAAIQAALADIAAGGAVRQPNKITLVDVGSLEFGGSTAGAAGDTWGPLLGPWASLLEQYTVHFWVGSPLVVESYDLGQADEPVPPPDTVTTYHYIGDNGSGAFTAPAFDSTSNSAATVWNAMVAAGYAGTHMVQAGVPADWDTQGDDKLFSDQWATAIPDATLLDSLGAAHEFGMVVHTTTATNRNVLLRYVNSTEEPIP